ncbi:hypothetical protein HERIO_147 [Hepatospora eriocheir]|uniref:Uncharacterized protein n=1 Tax=Hepatospora eriocheir TaxID=1081669 RepID=A0A1X0QED8_9MICR|nr:hypothetical protein HERIO_147 [Hepatospora eriocheir]
MFLSILNIVNCYNLGVIKNLDIESTIFDESESQYYVTNEDVYGYNLKTSKLDVTFDNKRELLTINCPVFTVNWNDISVKQNGEICKKGEITGCINILSSNYQNKCAWIVGDIILQFKNKTSELSEVTGFLNIIFSSENEKAEMFSYTVDGSLNIREDKKDNSFVVDGSLKFIKTGFN